MKVSEWIEINPGQTATIPLDCPLEKAVDRILMSEPCLRDLYVLSEEGEVIGHLAYAKLVHTYLAEHKPMHTRRQIIERIAGGTVGELMERHFAYASPEEALDDVINRQLEHEMENMPVLDEEGKLIGMVNMTAVLREMREHDFKDENE